MEDKLLINLCIFTTVIGLILLTFLSYKIEQPIIEISKITKNDISKSVKITGYVKKFTNKSTVATLTLEDKTGSIQVVMFKPENTKIKNNSEIEIQGKVSLYNNALQVYADEVRIIND